MATVVFRFGVASWWQPPELVVDQFRLGHQLSNALVATALDYEAEKASHWSSFPDVAAVEADLEAAADAVAEAKEQVAQHRQQVGHLKHVGAPQGVLRAERAVLRDAQATLREAQASAAALRKQRRDTLRDRFAESAAALAELADERRARVKALYGEFVQQRGLHHWSYYRIVQHHETARKLVGRNRTAGQAAELRFRAWDGTGELTVTLVRNAWAHGCARKGPPWPCATDDRPKPAPVDCPERREQDPPRSPAVLASGGGKWAGQFRLEPWTEDAEGWKQRPRSQRRGMAVLGLSGGRKIHVPVLVDQMLPPEADVPTVSLVRSEQAGQLRWHLCVTAYVPDPDPAPADQPDVAVHLGWRRRADGHIRVGVITSGGPLPPPPRELLRAESSSPGRKPDASAGRWKPHHRPYVEPASGGGWEIVVPAALWDIVGRPAAIRSRRDQAFNKIRYRLAAWLADYPEDGEPLGVDLARVKAWKSPRRLAGMVRRWDPSPKARARGVEPPPDLPREFAAELLPDLVAWWRRDLHLMRNEQGEGHDLRARRDDAWKQIGAWLGPAAGRLVVGDEDYRQLRRRSDPADDGPVMPTVAVEEAVRARASYVAPGLLRATLVAAATRRGVPVVKVAAKGLTRLHHECGHLSEPDPQFAERIVVTCSGCGGVYDQDTNAVALMLARAEGLTVPGLGGLKTG